MKEFCLTLDLKDDLNLINEYITWHKNVWPEVISSIKKSGILEMKIYQFSNRLCMILKVEDCFSFEHKEKLDKENPKVQEWENFMWKFQQEIPGSLPGEKWQLMNPIFSLSDFEMIITKP